MDQLYYESGYIQDSYYTYVADSISDIVSDSSIIISINSIKSVAANLSISSQMIATAGTTSRLTIIPGIYSSTAGKSTYGAFYIDAGPEVIA
jgi:hypothetical protein